MYSLETNSKNITTSSFSTSSFTSQFQYQPLFDSDDDVATICHPSPTPSLITLDFKTEIRVYHSSSIALPIDSISLWPRYPKPSKELSTTAMVSDLDLPETFRFGASIKIKGYDGVYYVNRYFTIYRTSLPRKALHISAAQPIGTRFRHIVFDAPYEYVLPFAYLPIEAQYVQVPHIESPFDIMPLEIPRDLFYSRFSTPSPNPAPSPSRPNLLRKIKSITMEMLKGKVKGEETLRNMEEGRGKSTSHLMVNW